MDIKATTLRNMAIVAVAFTKATRDLNATDELNTDRIPIHAVSGIFETSHPFGHLTIRDPALSVDISTNLRQFRAALKGVKGQVALEGNMINGLAVPGYTHQTKPLSRRPRVKLAASAVMAMAEFATALKETEFAITDSYDRKYLQGVFFECRNGNLRLVATDGYRLSMRDTDFQIDPDTADNWPKQSSYQNPGFILLSEDVRTLLALQRHFPVDTVSMAIDDREISFVSDRWEFTGELPDYTFPDYRRVMPGGNPMAPVGNRSIDLDLAAISADVKRVASMSDTRNHVAVFSKDQPRVGDINVPALAWDFDTYMAVGARHLVDTAKILPSATCSLYEETPRSPNSGICDPIAFTAASRPDLTVVLMPMRA